MFNFMQRWILCSVENIQYSVSMQYSAVRLANIGEIFPCNLDILTRFHPKNDYGIYVARLKSNAAGFDNYKMLTS